MDAERWAGRRGGDWDYTLAPIGPITPGGSSMKVCLEARVAQRRARRVTGHFPAVRGTRSDLGLRRSNSANAVGRGPRRQAASCAPSSRQARRSRSRHSSTSTRPARSSRRAGTTGRLGQCVSRSIGSCRSRVESGSWSSISLSWARGWWISARTRPMKWTTRTSAPRSAAVCIGGTDFGSCCAAPGSHGYRGEQGPWCACRCGARRELSATGREHKQGELICFGARLVGTV